MQLPASPWPNRKKRQTGDGEQKEKKRCTKQLKNAVVLQLPQRINGNNGNSNRNNQSNGRRRGGSGRRGNATDKGIDEK